MDKLQHLTELPTEPQGSYELPPSSTGVAIEVLDATVRGSDGSKLFHRLSASIAPGERVALQGPVRSGKSTLLDCLCGLGRVGEGSIQIDGFDLRYLHLQKLRSQVALVREAALFEGTLEENLTMRDPRLSLGDLQKTLTELGLWEWISHLPQGLQTSIHAGSPEVSGSRALELTLARAILSRPRLLVLDTLADPLVLPTRILAKVFDRNAPWTLVICTSSHELQRRCDYTLTLLNGSLKRERLA
jgi:putative ABC transport system ATP-binding protein